MASMLRGALENIGEAVLQSMEKFFKDKPLDIDAITRLNRTEIRALIMNEVKYNYLKDNWDIDILMFKNVEDSFKVKVVSVEGKGRGEAFEVMRAQMEKQREELGLADKLVGK